MLRIKYCVPGKIKAIMFNLTDKRFMVVLALFVSAMGFLMYSSSLNGEFIWDDHVLIETNDYVKDWSKTLRIFSENAASGAHLRSDYYRPLAIFTHLIDYSIWRLNPLGYHITNVLLHILVSLLVYWLVFSIYNNRFLPLISCILFLVHPIHSGTVSYISNRADLLSAFFLLLTLICYIKYLQGKTKMLFFAVLLSYALAILSKENALVLPLLLLLYHYVFHKKIKLKAILPVFLIVLVYLLFRVSLFKLAFTGIDAALKRVPGFFVAITNYLKILLFPFNLRMDYGNKIFIFFEPKAIFGFLITIALLIFAAIKRNSSKLISFSIFWFFISLLPVTSVYPVTRYYMAEQWLYLPSLGFFVIIGYLINSLYVRSLKAKYFSIMIVVVYVIACFFITFKQNNYWRQEIPFYKRTLVYNPSSVNAMNNLGNAYLRIADKENSMKQFRKAIAISPEKAEAYCNLGIIYLRDSDYRRAEGFFLKAIELDQGMAAAYYNLGLAYEKMSDKNKAVEYWEKAVKLNPGYALAYVALCGACNLSGKNINDRMVFYCKMALRLGYKSADLFYNLGNAYYYKGDRQKAIDFTLEAIKLNPGFVEAYNNLAATYSEEGRVEEAIGLWEKALEIKPDFLVAHFNLSKFYFSKKQYGLAIEHCDKIIESGGSVDESLLKLLQPYRKKS